jgi:hypothetical protein
MQFLAPFNRRRDVQKDQFICAFFNVSFRQFYRVTCIADTDEINAFDCSPVFNIKARNDSFF